MPGNEIYLAAMKEKTGLFATWPVNQPVALGDYGRLEGARFTRVGSLGEKVAKKFGTRKSQGEAEMEVSASSSRQIGGNVDGSAEAGVASGDATVKVSFDSEGGFLFVAAGTTVTEVDDLKKLGDLMREKHDRGEWNADHHVVVQLLTAEKVTILCQTRVALTSPFESKGDGPATAGALAKLDAGVGYVDSSGVATRVLGEGPVTPLMGLAYLKRHFFRGSELRVRDIEDEDDLIVKLEGDDALGVIGRGRSAPESLEHGGEPL